ncbi:MAG: efflux transporter outer membrane subunit [Lysobacteraceae bacterium]|nr:MAG: efflux transporter outer membrane subunit [Xanthomonadaceae bacterium]
MAPAKSPAQRTLRAFALTALASTLAACMVGPDYVRPESVASAQFAHAPADAAAVAAAPAADDAFWRSFGDPLLDRLVQEALTANHDLRIALATRDRVLAEWRGARFDALPVVTAGAEAADARASADQLPGADRDARDAERYGVTLAASWELDLFGRIRRTLEAGHADADAATADLAAAQVAIAGDLARSYFELRGLQERLRVARANVDNQRGTLRLVDARFEAGGANDFDTARARAQLESTLAMIPALEAQAAFSMHRIAVLAGRAPDALLAQLSEPVALPALPARIDPGTPGELLRQRPDVASAERRLHSATARIGVATADLFPRFTLGGLLGTQAVDPSALFARDSESRLVALGIDWSFLDVGHVRARIAASEADAAAALARYEQSVLLALEDTENALVRYARARSEDAHLERAAADSERAAALARVRFEAGATGLFEVLDAERTRLQAQDAHAAARTRSATGAVALYRALAGGWPALEPAGAGVAAALPSPRSRAP